MASKLDAAWEKLNQASRVYNRNPSEQNKKLLEKAEDEYAKAKLSS